MILQLWTQASRPLGHRRCGVWKAIACAPVWRAESAYVPAVSGKTISGGVGYNTRCGTSCRPRHRPIDRVGAAQQLQGGQPRTRQYEMDLPADRHAARAIGQRYLLVRRTLDEGV